MLIMEALPTFSTFQEFNHKVIELTLEFQDTYSKDNLLLVFNLVEGQTKQIIHKVIENAGLPRDLAADMYQDAFLKLWDVMLAYDLAKSPIFTSFWTFALKNHLVKSYQRQWRHKDKPDAVEKTSQAQQESDAQAKLHAAREFWKQELQDWRNENGSVIRWRNRKNALLVEALIRFRILQLPDDLVQHKDIAAKLGVSSGYVSKWEEWLREQLLQWDLKF
mgnify:CR=1 FL=1